MTVFGTRKKTNISAPRSAPNIDMSSLNRVMSAFDQFRINTEKEQIETDNLGMIKTQNEVMAMKNDLFNEVQETGDYQDMMDKWETNLSSVENTLPNNMSQEALDKRSMFIKSQSLITKDKIVDTVFDYRRKDTIAEVGLAIQRLKENAIQDTTTFSAADIEIKSLIDSIPGYTDSERDQLIDQKKNEITNHVIDQIIKEDPQQFLNNIDSFENRLTPNQLAIKKKEAKSSIMRSKAAITKGMAEERAVVKSMIPDQIASLRNTGESLYPNLLVDAKKILPPVDTIELIKNMDVALNTFNFINSTSTLPFNEQWSELQKLKPGKGDYNFAKKQTQYEDMTKTLKEKEKKYHQDPVSALEMEFSIPQGYKKDANIFNVRVAGQLAKGTPMSQVKLFSESESNEFNSAWKINEKNRGKNLTILLNSIPNPNNDNVLRNIALDSLDIDSNYKTAYRQAEGSQSRLNSIFSALNNKSFSQLDNASRQEVRQDVADFTTNDNTILKYYNMLANITGDANSLQIASDMQSLYLSVASDFKLKQVDDVSKETSNLLYGPEVPIIANDVVIGIDTEINPITESIQDDLQYYRDYEIQYNSNIYSPLSISRIKTESGRWVQSKNGFTLWNEDTRSKVVDQSGNDVFLTYDDFTNITNRRNKFESESAIQQYFPE